MKTKLNNSLQWMIKIIFSISLIVVIILFFYALLKRSLYETYAMLLWILILGTIEYQIIRTRRISFNSKSVFVKTMFRDICIKYDLTMIKKVKLSYAAFFTIIYIKKDNRFQKYRCLNHFDTVIKYSPYNLLMTKRRKEHYDTVYNDFIKAISTGS